MWFLFWVSPLSSVLRIQEMFMCEESFRLMAGACGKGFLQRLFISEKVKAALELQDVFSLVLRCHGANHWNWLTERKISPYALGKLLWSWKCICAHFPLQNSVLGTGSASVSVASKSSAYGRGWPGIALFLKNCLNYSVPNLQQPIFR